jgi:predicted metalloendopeptidase
VFILLFGILKLKKQAMRLLTKNPFIYKTPVLGIHAAYNAFVSASNFHGEDARLNNKILSQFSERQLFFMSYVRNLCISQTKDQIFAYLVAGVAPPSSRVLGMLQNFPTFRSAFNCPSNSKYVRASADICNVWVTEISEFF